MEKLSLFDDLARERVEFSPTEQIPLARINAPADGLAPSRTLVASIQQYGIIEDLLLSPKNGGRFDIVAGTRRFLAAKEVGLESVPAKMVRAKGGQRLSPAVIGLVTNRLRSENILSDIRFIQRLRASGYADSDIASITGLTIPEIRRRDAIWFGDYRIEDLLRENRITPSMAERVAKLPINRQTSLLDSFEASGDRRLTPKHLEAARLVDTSVPSLPADLFDLPCASLASLVAGRSKIRVILDDVEIQCCDESWSVRRLGAGIDEVHVFTTEGDAVHAAVKLLEES